MNFWGIFWELFWILFLEFCVNSLRSFGEFFGILWGFMVGGSDLIFFSILWEFYQNSLGMYGWGFWMCGCWFWVIWFNQRLNDWRRRRRKQNQSLEAQADVFSHLKSFFPIFEAHFKLSSLWNSRLHFWSTFLKYEFSIDMDMSFISYFNSLLMILLLLVSTTAIKWIYERFS